MILIFTMMNYTFAHRRINKVKRIIDKLFEVKEQKTNKQTNIQFAK